MGKKKFAAVALDPEHKTYVVHVVSLNSTLLDIHPFRRSQISGLITKEALTKISNKYANFAVVFSPDLAAKLLKYTGINGNAIEQVDG